MPEQQGQAQQALTAEEVRSIVDESLSGFDFATAVGGSEGGIADTLVLLDGKVDGLALDLSQVRTDLAAMEDASGAVVEVRATATQVETAKSALRVLCTEGLVLIVVLSINAGLIGWQAFRGRFVSNG